MVGLITEYLFRIFHFEMFYFIISKKWFVSNQNLWTTAYAKKQLTHKNITTTKTKGAFLKPLEFLKL